MRVPSESKILKALLYNFVINYRRELINFIQQSRKIERVVACQQDHIEVVVEEMYSLRNLHCTLCMMYWCGVSPWRSHTCHSYCPSHHTWGHWPIHDGTTVSNPSCAHALCTCKSHHHRNSIPHQPGVKSAIHGLS